MSKKIVEEFEVEGEDYTYVYDFDELEAAAQSRAIGIVLHNDRAMKGNVPTDLNKVINDPATEYVERAFACLLRKRLPDGTLTPWNKRHCEMTGEKPGETLKFSLKLKGRENIRKRERALQDFFDVAGRPQLMLLIQFPGGLEELKKLADDQETLERLQNLSDEPSSSNSKK